jgi:hypothetical protein
MDRKDWFAPLLAVLIGIMGTLGGSLMTGYHHERAAYRQAQIDLSRQLSAERAAELKSLKDAGMRYLGANDAFVNALLLTTGREKALAEQYVRVQTSGNEVIIVADEELARQTRLIDRYLAELQTPNGKPMEQRLDELNTLLVDWIKQFKRSLERLKARSEDVLTLQATTQTAAQLRR